MSETRVNIESVRLGNFLSFYAGTVEFDKGLTVLAGPNGSGKTSIFHALKFALGSNQRENRYSKWSDFIRHGASTAEVEISVKVNGQSRKFLRRIDRDGIPRAYTDGRRVKAAEHKQLINALGLETDNPLVFMPQERINAIREMDPFEVRRLVEEGTGLDILRDRIGLQETEVSQSRQKLEVALAESKTVERELELLQHDIFRLEKKRALQTQERELEQELKWSSFDDLSERIQQTKDEIETKESGLVGVLEEQSTIEGQISEEEENSTKLEASMSILQTEIGRIIANIEEEERNLAKLKGDSKKQIVELRQLESNVKAEKRKEEKLKDDLERVSAAREQYLDQQKTLSEEIKGLEEERTRIRDELAAFAEWNTKRAEAHGHYKALQAEIEGKDLLMRSLRERLQVEEAELQAIESKWSHVWDKIEETDAKELEGRKSQLEREIASLNEERFRKTSRVAQLQKEIDDIKVRLSETSKRIPESVRDLSEAISEHNLESVKGPLISLFTADDEISPAVEGVLAGNLPLAFVTTDFSDYQLLLKLRNKEEAPSPIIFLREEEVQERPELPQGAGVEDWLWDRLSADEEIQSLLGIVFGNFVLVKNSQTAARLASKRNFRVVTRDGSITIPSDSQIVSHPKSEPSGMVSTAPLQSRLVKLEKDLTIERRHVTDIMAKLETLSNSREETLELISQMTRWGSTWERRRKLNESIPELEERIVSIDDELKTLQRDYGRSERNLRKLDNTQPPERSRLVGQESAIRTKHRRLQSDLTKVDTKAYASEKDEELKRQELKGVKESITVLSDSLADLREEIKQSKDATSSILEKIEIMREGKEETKKRQTEIREELAEVRTTIRTLSETLVELNLHVKNRRLEVLQSKRQLTNLEYELELIEQEIQGKTKPESIRSIDLVRRELVKLRHILDDYQDVSETVAHTENQLKGRLGELVKRVAELGEELEEAESTVRTIREQYHNGMNETLRKVEKGVNEVLGRVQFPGSVRFELALRDGRYGVEFKSRIKTEGFGDISAGSGGERSLIAIGLILALQRFNPAPVYVMDEVDTFLDATNTELVSRLFHDASRRSQFILLTPAKSTHLLKHADKILGVVSPNGVEPSVIIESPKFKAQ
ncbi:MAG: chromosome segregation SMC family protein [Candidatus Thorarchaeota archaeon]|jgi:chromosome segregation protein